MLTWTTDRPTAPGWYWWQGPYSGPEVVRLWQTGKGQSLICERTGHVAGHPVPLVGRWAGPLTPPEGV